MPDKVSQHQSSWLQSCIIPIFVKVKRFSTDEGVLLPEPFYLTDVTQSTSDVSDKIRETYGCTVGDLTVDREAICSTKPAYYHIDRKFWLFSGIAFEKGAMQLFIKTGSGPAICLNVHPWFTIEDVKVLIRMRKGIPVDQNRWFFAGKQLQNERTLMDYKICHESTAHMILRVRGGGPEPVLPLLLSNLEDRDDIKFNKSAPKWRSAEPGLCLEGPCKNDKCRAFRKMVICNMGLCEFSLAIDGNRVKCPICWNKVIAVTTAFNNCQFYFFGVYRVPTTDGGIVHKQSAPQTVGDVYKRFDEWKTDGTSAVVAWEFLKIVTVAPSAEIGFVCCDTECPVCLRTMSDQGSRTAACGHRYHSVCFDLIKRCKPACPQCDGQL